MCVLIIVLGSNRWSWEGPWISVLLIIAFHPWRQDTWLASHSPTLPQKGWGIPISLTSQVCVYEMCIHIKKIEMPGRSLICEISPGFSCCDRSCQGILNEWQISGRDLGFGHLPGHVTTRPMMGNLGKDRHPLGNSPSCFLDIGCCIAQH